MKRNSITRRITGAILAAAFSLAGLAAATSFEPDHTPDQAEEVAGATWSLVGPGDDDKGGPPVGTLGSTWS